MTIIIPYQSAVRYIKHASRSFDLFKQPSYNGTTTRLARHRCHSTIASTFGNSRNVMVGYKNCVGNYGRVSTGYSQRLVHQHSSRISNQFRAELIWKRNSHREASSQIKCIEPVVNLSHNRSIENVLSSRIACGDRNCGCSLKTRCIITKSFPMVRHMSTSSQSIDTRKRSRDNDDVTSDSCNEYVKQFKEIPGPKGLPYFGVLPLFILDGRFEIGYKIRDFHNFLISCYNRYGQLFKINLNGSTTIHVFGPDLVQKVYQNVGKTPDIVPLLETTQMYRKYRGMSLGLGNTNGDDWYRMRTAVQQIMMVPRTVPAFLPQVNSVADEFINERIERLRNIETGELKHLTNELAKWNLESSAMTCFETRLGCLTKEAENKASWHQQMIDANESIFKLSAGLYFSLPWHYLISTPTWKKIIEAEDFFFGNGQRLVDETCTKIRRHVENSATKKEAQAVDVSEMKDENAERDGDGWAFLRYLMHKCATSEGTFTYKDLSIITLSLFADGLSTTVPTLVGQLYCLASNTDKQNKLWEEIQRIAPKHDQPITDDILQQATYLKACIKEGFRFFPVGTDVSRILNKDIVLGGYHIPAGTALSLNNNLLLRNEQYFTQPERYEPERWLRGSSGRHLHPYLLLPFGHGTRMCAGMRLAEQEMRVLIIKLLQRYRLDVADNSTPLSQKYCMLLRPDRDPIIKFIPRKQ